MKTTMLIAGCTCCILGGLMWGTPYSRKVENLGLEGALSWTPTRSEWLAAWIAGLGCLVLDRLAPKMTRAPLLLTIPLLAWAGSALARTWLVRRLRVCLWSWRRKERARRRRLAARSPRRWPNALEKGHDVIAGWTGKRSKVENVQESAAPEGAGLPSSWGPRLEVKRRPRRGRPQTEEVGRG